MFANERQNTIYNMIRSDGAVMTADLVKHFGVSIETVRRDLLAMEQRGLIVRVHGGAVAKNGMKPYSSLTERNREGSRQKHSLSLKATEFISEGDIIGVDSGSTALAFAEALSGKFSKLTIITHSLDVFQILRDQYEIILCGGHYMEAENAFYGPLTIQMLESLHMPKAFLFPSTISLECGICDYQPDLYLIQKLLLRSADEIFILADSSKYEKKALFRLDDMNTDYHYITDGDLPEQLRKLYAENNIRIYTGRK